MDIIFLGTGGGRINLIKQVRGTGGFRINSQSANIHVDPGPGALLHSKRVRQRPMELDVIIVTHRHIDHFSDAMVMIEGMSRYGLEKKGILIGSQYVIDGDENGDRGVHKYHQQKVTEVYSARFNERRKFVTPKGEFEIEVFQMKHDEPTAFGFKLHMDGKVVGYITDTEYREEFGREFSGCDYLIVNCIKPESDEYHGHLKTGDVIEILKVAKPKNCIMTHLGLKMLKVGPELEAKKIQDASGVRTLAAMDGMIISF